jgi:hypothetical protein
MSETKDQDMPAASNLGARSSHADDPNDRPTKRVRRVQFDLKFPHAEAVAKKVDEAVPALPEDVSRLVASFLDQPNALCMKEMSDEEIAADFHDPSVFRHLFHATLQSDESMKTIKANIVFLIAKNRYHTRRRLLSSLSPMSEAEKRGLRDYCVTCGVYGGSWTTIGLRLSRDMVDTWTFPTRLSMDGLHYLCKRHNPDPFSRTKTNKHVVCYRDCVEWQ